MKLARLAREVALAPLALAQPAVGLVKEAGRAVMTEVGDLRSHKVKGVDRSGVDIAHRRRRQWTGNGRAHIELREVDDVRTAEYLSAVQEALSEQPGVEAVRFLPGLGRVVVDHDASVTGAEVLGNVLGEVEESLALDEYGLGRHRPDHPADREPIVEGVITIGADLAGATMASAARALRIPAIPFEIDFAALLTIASYVPWVRGYFERHASTPALGTSLAVSRALAAGLSQSVVGPLTDMVHRGSKIGAAVARRQAWLRLEPVLVGWHDCDGTDGFSHHTRPGALPLGPVERFAAPTSAISAAVAGLGMAVRPNVERALSFLVAGTPKAARWGREAFAAHLGTYLAQRNLLVLDPAALERLDRIDTLVVIDELVVRPQNGRWEPAPFAPELMAAARDAGLDVWVSTPEASHLAGLHVEGLLGPGSEAAEAVAAMQGAGRGVAVIASGPHPALTPADVGLGLLRPGVAPAWEASIIGGEDLLDGYLLLLAIAEAKRASRQAAHLALAGTGAGALMAIGGLVPGNLRRVMSAVDLASLVAHVNGARIAASLAAQPLPSLPDLRPLHALSGDDVLAVVESRWSGLSEEEVAARRGDVRRPRPAVFDLAQAIGNELINPFTPFLSAGAGLSAAAGSWSDAVLIGTVLALNAAIGGTQRFRADRATAALLERERMQVTVRRGGLTKTVFSDEVVDGEIIVLAPGDVIPSDCRLLMSNSLEVDESTLTGESLPVGKSSKPCDVDLPVADRTSMVYAGTTVVAGTGLAVTVATGSQTEAYRGLLLAGRPESRTGIEPRLEELTTMVTPAAVLAGLGVLGAGLARGHPMTEVLSGGVSLAVAAVPEGLPLLATAAQQASARRLARRGVVVRNVRAIEALGRVDVVCADKTGTLTLGRIRVKVVSDGRRDEPPSEVMAGRRRVLAMARAATPDPDSARRLPHPTDRAILYAVDDAGLSRRAEFGDWQRVSELPFEPGRGFHATLGDTADGRIVAVKGAPEVLLPRCAYLGGSRKGPVRATNEDHRRWQRKAEELASTGLRLLAVAETTLDPEEDLTDEALDELTFVGLIGLDDSVRESSREAVDDLARAGVKVLMITGDHPVTARGVAAELGLPADLILTGPELDRIDDVDLGERLERTAVCARVTPAHKVRIVRALKDRGHMVAMTGDGANDAPAIRLADVGIALGTRATDAARDASDLVVTDDRIETIVHAIVEGRSLWASVRDATAVLVGGNVGEMAFTLGGSLIAGIPPINTRQLLLINLLTDVLPAMAIAVSPPPGTQPEDFMALGPDTALGRELNQAVAERAVTTTVGATAGWLAGRVTGRRRRAGTIALASLVGTELGQTLATGWRSPLVVASCVGSWAALVTAVQTPGVSRLFGCTPLGPIAWSQALGSAGLATLGSTIWSAVRDLQPGEQEGEPEPAVEAVTAA